MIQIAACSSLRQNQKCTLGHGIWSILARFKPGIKGALSHVLTDADEQRREIGGIAHLFDANDMLETASSWAL